MKKSISNNRYNRLFTIAAATILLLGCCSCKDFLNIDEYFDDELKIDSVFSSKRNIEAYMWGAAAQFPDEGRLFRSPYTPGPYATDESFTLAGLDEYRGMAYAVGEVNASNINGSPFNAWNNMYRIIRKCNTIFARIDEARDWTTTDRSLIVAYTRFIRAYAYYHILVDFGPPILLGDRVYASNEPIEYYNTVRGTYDDAVEYICSELEEAARFLPYRQQLLNFGRPTRGAAYGLIARLRLIHASPMFNGGQIARSYYSGWVRKTDGKHYIQQEYRPERWAVAAAAAKRVIELRDPNGKLYELYTVKADGLTPPMPVNVTSDPNFYQPYPDGAAGIDHYRSVSELHNGEAVAAINREYVWGRHSSEIDEMTRRAFPISADGWSECCIPQKIIDNFRMIDGHTIYNSSPDYPYSETGYSTSEKTFSGYRLLSGVHSMYVNREARFYAFVGFSECFWSMSSTNTNGVHDMTIRYYYDSPDGKSAAHNSGIYTATGYVPKKTIHPIDAHTGENARRMPKAFGIIRYAEILLSYAEALNNLGGDVHTVTLGEESFTVSRDIEAMRNAFNQVRYRAGLPGITLAEAGSQSTVQELIEQERMIEFMHENRRYYDVRRWGIYEKVENEPIMGMNTDATKESYYSRTVVNSVRISTRVVNRKMIFLPIHRDEVRRMPDFDQNPGWEE
ncbi:MAG: RagB/SusD family nutrient uptake outer membrane protein [Prevotellaceae bacterium]|jgi:hypothetical protein|nr:RagB/SusD family nutrient uptake outer membrane protein [Prevotellaceae bacterium]